MSFSICILCQDDMPSHCIHFRVKTGIIRPTLIKAHSYISAISILVVHMLITTKFHYLPESIAIIFLGKYDSHLFHVDYYLKSISSLSKMLLNG